jgi:hypothetical protein
MHSLLITTSQEIVRLRLPERWSNRWVSFLNARHSARLSTTRWVCQIWNRAVQWFRLLSPVVLFNCVHSVIWNLSLNAAASNQPFRLCICILGATHTKFFFKKFFLIRRRFEIPYSTKRSLLSLSNHSDHRRVTRFSCFSSHLTQVVSREKKI